MARAHRLIARAARIWWTIRRPRTLGVRAIVLDGADRIALIHHTYRPHWYLPGGGVHRKEPFDVALARELREEIGLEAFRVERILGVYRNRHEFKDDHVVIFVVRTIEPEVTIRAADTFEIEQARWFPIDALPDDISAASARRIEEYREGAIGGGDW